MKSSAEAYERHTPDKERPKQVCRLHYFRTGKLEDSATIQAPEYSVFSLHEVGMLGSLRGKWTVLKRTIIFLQWGDRGN